MMSTQVTSISKNIKFLIMMSTQVTSISKNIKFLIMNGFTKEEIAELLAIDVDYIVDEDIECFNEIFFRDEALYRNLRN